MNAPQPCPDRVLTAFLEAVPEIVVLLDSAGQILLFNPACERLTGYSREEAVGRKPLDFLVPAKWTGVVRERFADPFAPAVIQPHVNPWLTKSGEERLIRWHCRPLGVEGAAGPFILGVGTDVTEQVRIEEEAKHQRELLETFFDSVMSCAVLLDREFNFIRVNQAYASACGREISGFRGKNHFELYPSDAKAIFEGVVRTRQPYSVRARPFEYTDDLGRGVTYWDWTLVPILDRHGEVEVLLFCLNDVTERIRAEERLRALTAQLLDVQESERREMARELHDEIGHALTGIKLAIDLLQIRKGAGARKELERIQQAVVDLMETARSLSLRWHPQMLDDLGLLPALAWLTRGFQDKTGVKIHFTHEGIDERRFSASVENAIFRIAQEALTNVARHSGARLAVLVVSADREAIELTVSDTGKGFDPETLPDGRRRGLDGMRERAKLIGGVLRIDAGPGQGTVVYCRAPVEIVAPPATVRT